VNAAGDRWTLRAPQPPRTRVPRADADTLSAMVGLEPGAIANPLWVDTGTEQLLLPVRSVAELRAARTDAARLTRDAGDGDSGPALAYLFAESGPGEIESRCFFVDGGGVTEDPATGSACANLGGWLLANAAALPATRTVAQGAQVGRPSRLELDARGERDIRVTGEVVALGRGTIRL
jgi:PhzF family phenazine biosynthesis protein